MTGKRKDLVRPQACTGQNNLEPKRLEPNAETHGNYAFENEHVRHYLDTRNGFSTEPKHAWRVVSVGD